MERRSKMLLATALGATIVVVACSFPDVTYRSDDGDAGSTVDAGAPEEDTGTDAAPGIEDSGGADSDAPALIEAGLPTDGGIIEDASECEGEDAGLRRCDCDGDDWLIKGCDAGPNSGKKGSDKDGWDCDDLDFDVNPDSDFKAVPMRDGGWDWNCSGNVEKSYPDGYVCKSSNCKSTGKNGFEMNQPCGAKGSVHACTSLLDLGLLSCKDTVQLVDAVQGCR